MNSHPCEDSTITMLIHITKFLFLSLHTHTHTHIYIYMYVYICVVYIYKVLNINKREIPSKMKKENIVDVSIILMDRIKTYSRQYSVMSKDLKQDNFS